MLKTKLPIYLASQSPRRKILLKQIGLNFTSFSFDLDEKFIATDSPIKTVKRLASQKMHVAESIKTDGIIITADTIVVLAGEIIGKPKNKNDAKKILEKLSNNKHFVYTGFAIKNSVSNKIIIDYEKTEVTFRVLTTKEIKNYIASGSPMDKAGAYGIQDDFGAVFVSKINGCYYNVVGLPLSKVYSALKEIVWLRDKIKKNIIVSIIISIIIYLSLAIWGNIDTVISTLSSFQWKFFPLILIIIYITFLLKFLKWQYYLRLSKVKIKTSDSFQIFMATLTMSVTPGKMGELIKPYMVKNLVGTSTSTTIPIVFAERVTEFFSLIFLVALGVDVVNNGIVILIIMLLIFIILVIIILNKRISNWIISKISNIHYLNKYIVPLKISLEQSRTFLKVKPFSLMFLLSLIVWIIEAYAFYLVLNNFSINVLYVESLFTYLFSVFIGSVSFLPAGLGVTDGSITYMLSNNGVSKELSISSALIIRIATLWFSLLVGLIGMFGYKRISSEIKNKDIIK